MIYLSPMQKSGYGEETFWVWFEKNFENILLLYVGNYILK
jgi:hypothetical protein